MAESSRFLRALRRIVDTTRKTSQNPRPMPTLQNTPSVLTSLPEHKSLLPLLLSFDIPSKLAKACSDRYDGYVGQLKLETEIKLAPYLSNRKKSHPAQAYSLFLNNYNQTLQLWSHSILNAALVSLKRDSVELRDLEVTYPAPLWLPPPPARGFSHSGPDRNCPLSQMARPIHAFPTTYPPPLRPSSGISPVEWPRTPEASPAASVCTIDIDSLCNLFAASLKIDENPRQPRQPKPSIFSLPVVAREVFGTVRSRPKPLKRKCSPRAKEPPTPFATKLGTSPPKTHNPRQNSAPPFPSLSTRSKVTLRKTSAPSYVFTSRQAPESWGPSDSTYLAVPTTPTSLNTPTGDSGTYPHLIPSLLSDRRSPFNSTLDTTSHPPRVSSPSFDGPTTPPTLLPDLFSEPIVVSATPVRLSPRSSLMHIADPFLQFESHNDYLSGPSFGSTLNYSTSSGPVTSCFSKSAFDTPLGFDHLFHGILIPTTSDHFESALFNTYTMQ